MTHRPEKNAMPPISRRTFLAYAAAGSAAVLVGCGDNDETNTTEGTSTDTVADSNGVTGTLNLLNFTGWAGPTTYADFAERYPGASVNEIAWVSNDDTIAKARDRAGDIDVVLVDGSTFPRLTALEVLAELGELPSMTLVADQYKGNSWDPEDRFFAPTDHGRTGIVYRRDLVTEPPTSWTDFFAMAPDYSGQVAMLDFQASVIDNVLVMLDKPIGSTDDADLDAVLEVLTTVKPHLLAVTTEVGQAVASGDAVMAMCDAYDAQLALTSNSEVAFVDPSEGQVGYLEGLAILDGPRNDLARAFVDFFLEEENYAAFINNVASPYVQPDNPGIDEVLRNSPVINPPAEVMANVGYHLFLGEEQAKWDATWDAFKVA